MWLLKDLFHEKRNFCVCFYHMITVPHFFESKKTRIEILRRSVKFSARELRSETIECIFGWCRYQNNPRLSWSLSYVAASLCTHLRSVMQDCWQVHKLRPREIAWADTDPLLWFRTTISETLLRHCMPTLPCKILTSDFHVFNVFEENHVSNGFNVCNLLDLLYILETYLL